ncbi:MAG: hypothetical protein KKD59_07205, partial [Acidobacteria bacterium]|nr:hypothetical protein [Acidobacteriota bacterium]
PKAEVLPGGPNVLSIGKSRNMTFFSSTIFCIPRGKKMRSYAFGADPVVPIEEKVPVFFVVQGQTQVQ